MKALYTSIKFVSAAILMMAAGACTEEVPEYVKAEVPEGAQVFFKDVPASFDLTDGDGTIEITAYRGNASSEVSVGLTSEADAIFSVPASVSFASGAETSVITISYDPAEIVPETPYDFTLAFADNTTPYGASSCSFSAGAVTPQLWTEFAVATITEEFWGEEHKHIIKYREEGNIRYGIVQKEEKCGWDNPPCAGGLWGTGVDFEFVWYTDIKDEAGNELIVVPYQFMGWQNAGADVYFGDLYSFYNDPWGQNVPSGPEFYAMSNFAGEQSYYDGNGGFFFNLLYHSVDMELGYSFGGVPAFDVVAICDGFTRTTDYNKDVEYSALYEGEMASNMFSVDGEAALEFAQSVRYNADYTYDPEKDTELVYTEYYLPDYFKEGYGLAFMAPIPEQLEDGAEITDVANLQETGLVMFGNELFVNVKKGSVSFVNGSELPTITLKVAVYSLDADGNKTFDFDQFEEVYTALAYGKDNYTWEDIYGLEKADFVGDYDITYKDWFRDDVDGASRIMITDGGQNAEGTEILEIRNLSGWYSEEFDDVVYAEWVEGFVYVYPTVLANMFPYDGQEFPISLYSFDPVGAMTSGAPLILGYLPEDGAFAFVAYPGYDAYLGLYLANADIGGLNAIYNIVATPAADEGSNYVAAPASRELKPLLESAARPMSASERRINSSKAVPYTRPAKDFSSVVKVL